MQTVLAAMTVLGMIGGPILGGLLADHAGWRWAFRLNLPLGLAAWLLIALVLPQCRPATAPTGRLDAAGVLLLTGGPSAPFPLTSVLLLLIGWAPARRWAVRDLAVATPNSRVAARGSRPSEQRGRV
ncbi:MFS transporter [Kitasatospora aureofaciens]|uniref:MFS transporter n=1 Tax=Kitasatospora aureofaciens TaxID=1894 RepID=UPI0037CC283C